MVEVGYLWINVFVVCICTHLLLLMASLQMHGHLLLTYWISLSGPPPLQTPKLEKLDVKTASPGKSL